jgi:hypothetical protein
MSVLKSNLEFTKIITFLKDIGIDIVEKELDEATFLPGLSLGSNCIFIDLEKLEYPGDILHEAGHLAVTTPLERHQIGTENMSKDWPSQGEEIATMLWSFAACKHLELPLEYVFHAGGYKGSSNWLMDNFSSGNYIGLPFLEWTQMSLSIEKAHEHNKPAFPEMIKWMRE